MSEDELMQLSANLKNIFNHNGYKSDMQKQAIECVFKGENDVLVLFPTGAGKSLVYQLPATTKDGLCVVISPLLSLIEDQVNNLKKKNINAIVLDSSIQLNKRKELLENYIHLVRSNNNKNTTKCCSSVDMLPLQNLKFIYITPEMACTSTMMNFLVNLSNLNHLKYLVIDEAHCISSWGHEFRPSYLNIGTIRSKCRGCCCVAVTATATKHMTNDIVKLLNMENVEIFQMSCYRPNLFYEVKFVELLHNKTQFDDLIDYIKLIAKLNTKLMDDCNFINNIAGIIYCRTRDMCDEIAQNLCRYGFNAASYHASLSNEARKKIQNSWLSNHINIIVATISFGMGVDKPDVRFIVHWNIASSIEAYYQETGRAGRDGYNSYCRLYYSKNDRDITLSLVNRSQSQYQEKSISKYSTHIDTMMDKLVNVIAYVENPTCRHLFLSKSFGENLEKCNKHCDYCVSKSYIEKCLEEWDFHHRGLVEEITESLCMNPVEEFLKNHFSQTNMSNVNLAFKKTNTCLEYNIYINRILYKIIKESVNYNVIDKQKTVSCFLLIAANKTRQFIPDLNINMRLKNVTSIKWSFKKRIKKCNYSLEGNSINLEDQNIIPNKTYECWYLCEYLAMKYSTTLASYMNNILTLKANISVASKNDKKLDSDITNNIKVIHSTFNRKNSAQTLMLPVFLTASQMMNQVPRPEK